MQINLSHDGLDGLNNQILFVEYGTGISEQDIIADQRVGVEYAGEEAALQPLRFSIKDSRYVSILPKIRNYQFKPFKKKERKKENVTIENFHLDNNN